ncbi:hypothetical protein HaLaN_23947 [Haematococcus lacustris]|uniref:Uncharacterized protein n=1 Tax=Haematococcus lacustris TaxID=44745 RepID=A0A6A0A2A3_HAELA|nr:hypothetical protein HaLaN_23947 [Haematococcus lacustris]
MGKEYPDPGYKRLQAIKAAHAQRDPNTGFLQQLAAATPAGTTLDSLEAHTQAPKATWGPLWEEYLSLAPASERVIEGSCKKHCELHLPRDRPRPVDLVPPAGQVNQRLAPPWGRWLDRDINGCLNFHSIGESMQRPLELCRYEGLDALPPVGKEYQQRYKLVHDRVPKGRQRVHRAAEYRRGIGGRARNNA